MATLVMLLSCLSAVAVVAMAATPAARRLLGLLDQLLPGASWDNWKTAIDCMLGQPPANAKAAALIEKCTGLSAAMQKTLKAALTWVFIVGRRGGKTIAMAALAIHLSVSKKYRAAPGERLVGMLLAADRKQAGVLKGYISGLLHSVPALEKLIAKETADSIELVNGITIEIHTSSYKTVRGYSCIFVIGDEVAFWPSDGADTAEEVITALQPTLATTGGPLVIISSPHARTGALFNLWQRHYGRAADTRVWVSDSRTMNPTLDQRVIDRAYADGPEAASSEWGAQWRSDLSPLFDPAVLAACVTAGRPLELPPQPGLHYVAHVDSSGGSDESFALAIGHKGPEGRIVINRVAA